jgi:hypothetical protein
MHLKECLLIPNELYWGELGQPPEYEKIISEIC